MVLDRIQRVLEPDFVEAIDTLAMEEVRDRRAECQALEEILSYVRRVIQARLDIVLADIERRESGDDATPGDLSGLLADLPDILSEHGRGQGGGRLAAYHDPAEASHELLEQVDRVVGVDTLARLAELDDERVRWLAGALADLERSISEGRRKLHSHLDTFQAEIVRRYKAGDVSVDDLLKPR